MVHKTRYLITSGVFALLFLFINIPANSQDDGGSDYSLLDSEYSFMQNKPELGVQLGSSFNTFGSGNSFFTQSVAPHLTWDMSKKFSLTAGTILSTTNFGSGSSMMFSNGSETMAPRQFSSTFYAFGAYRVNPKVTVTGGAWAERNNLNLMMMQNQMNPQAFNLNAGGMMMGLDYKVSENFRIGAEFSVSNGYNPFSPYSNSIRPFHHSPFDRRRGW